ncbi:terminase small subunit [Rhodobacteraceae bacterium NNCM2]|nr:terminase small subunit [Coraliihabitans acroporae]
MARKTDNRLVSKTDLASIMGVATQTLDQWLNRGMPYVSKPGAGSGKAYVFDLGQVISWRLEYERSQLNAAGADVDLSEAKRRKAAAEATLAEMALAEAEGRLLKAEDVDAMVIGFVTVAKTRLLAMPSKLAPTLATLTEPGECEAEVKQEVYDALRELSSMEPEGLDKALADMGIDPEKLARLRTGTAQTEPRQMSVSGS